MSRRDLSLPEKIAILDAVKAQPPGASHRQLAEAIKVPKSTISRLLQQQQTLREEWMREGFRAVAHKRKRKGKDPDVEDALNRWFSIATMRGVPVNGPILNGKSEEFARQLGHLDFRATDGWLSRWKCRHDINYKKACGVDKKSEKLPDLEKINGDDIYNTDETGLQTGIIGYTYETLSNDKVPKEERESDAGLDDNSNNMEDGSKDSWDSVEVKDGIEFFDENIEESNKASELQKTSMSSKSNSVPTTGSVPPTKDPLDLQVEQPVATEHNDADKHFLLSLLPHLHCLTPAEKLHFQIKTLNIINEIMNAREKV